MNLKKYFVFDTSDGNYEELKTKKVFRTLYKGVKIPWFRIIIGAFLAVFNVLVLMTQYDNYMALYQGTLTDLKPLFFYLLASFIQYVLIFLSFVSDRALVEVVISVSKKIWSKMMKLPVREFETSKPGGMLSRITQDAEYAGRPFYAVLVGLQGIVTVLTLSAVFPDNVGFAAPYLIILLLLGIALAWYTATVLSRSITYVQNKKAEQTDHYNELLSNIRFVKASRAEEKSIAKSDEYIEKRYDAALYVAYYNGLLELVNNYSNVTLAVSFFACVLAIGSGKIINIEPVSSLYAFIFAVGAVIVGFMAFPTHFAEAIGGTKKIAALLRKDEENINSGDDLTQNGDIVLKNVSFAYNKLNTIKNVDVKIPVKETTAIVGINGSGKSTLIKLIDRLYQGNDGEIYLGENKASSTSLKSWRNKFAVVSQKAALISGSIRDNICYGIENVSDEEILKAGKLAGLEELVNEKGLDYEVGTAGSKLSGGEAQRVSIARALIKNPEYLILDEATANLDTKTEILVRDGIEELMKDRTVIVIAHDYATIENADNVIVMRDGTVEDFGKKDEMIKRNQFMKLMVGA